MRLLLFLFVIAKLSLATAPGTNGDFDNSKIRQTLETEAKQYLYRFGYMPASKSKDDDKSPEPTKQDLQNALMRFQKEFLFYRSGIVDVPTQAKLDEYRCANRDMYKGEPLEDLPKSELWQKKTILWNITSYPTALTITETREACEEAFEKWRKASDIHFVEVGNAAKADVIIEFRALPDAFLNVAGGASKPLNSVIVFDKNRLWGYRNHLPQGISLFHALLHEIGHILGLHHTFYRGSIMFPILKPALVPYGTLDDVPNIDKIALRKLYGLAQLPTEHGFTPDVAPSKCPKYLDSVTAVTGSEWVLFRGDKVFKVNGRRFVDDGKKIQQVFPKGPEFVNATVSSQGLVLLFAERTIYGYEYDGVAFTEARDFPRELHERVLFYPQAAFPLNNGSVVLLSGNVFATYNVLENAPSFLNDKHRFFPNLPEDLRSGIQKDQRADDQYWMFDEGTVSTYDMSSKQVIQLESLSDFVKC